MTETRRDSEASERPLIDDITDSIAQKFRNNVFLERPAGLPRELYTEFNAADEVITELKDQGIFGIPLLGLLIQQTSLNPNQIRSYEDIAGAENWDTFIRETINSIMVAEAAIRHPDLDEIYHSRCQQYPDAF